ncbi:activating transcription factor 7-interacting protein 2 isoform X4 [Haliaeetus albicilla]|uniref:activating transcription factor 7-interacting protein 2 isoform X4 n=1 Tax=Haliaeetus albicilla TaxID=8969 RepID=UPI0037E9BBC5
MSEKEESLLGKKKVSKLERRINAVVAFQEEVFSKVAVHQTMLPSADYQNTVLSQLGSSAFCPDINIPTRSSNTLLLSPCTGFTAAHVSEYVSSDEVILVSVEDQNSATSNTSAIPNNQMSTQAETSATVQSEMKERKLKVIDLTEEPHNCSQGRTEKDQKYLSNKQFEASVPQLRLPKAERRNIK